MRDVIQVVLPKMDVPVSLLTIDLLTIDHLARHVLLDFTDMMNQCRSTLRYFL